MWSAWHFGGEDPWRLKNMLTADYRPLGKPDSDPVVPRYARRYKAFLLACAQFSARQAGLIEKVVPPNRAAKRAAKRGAKRRAR